MNHSTIMKNLTEPQKEWLAALRSGEYQQTTNMLEADEKFCCLGVACKVAEKHGIVLEMHNDGSLVGVDLSDQLKVKNWLGLKWDHGILPEECYEGHSLVELNDGGSSFREIADIIEQYSDVLFVQDAS